MLIHKYTYMYTHIHIHPEIHTHIHVCLGVKDTETVSRVCFQIKKGRRKKKKEGQEKELSANSPVRQLLQKLRKAKETVSKDLLNAREYGFPRLRFKFQSAAITSEAMTVLFNSVSVFLAFLSGQQ